MDIKNYSDSGNIKCHKCRKILIEDITRTYKSVCSENCNSFKSSLYLEDQLPTWIQEKVEEEQWTKGKLHCVNCGSKVGSFDYVSGRKCDCGHSLLPPVHLLLRQIDIPVLLSSLS